MKITNLTPHAITLIKSDGSRETFPPSGTVARVKEVAFACAFPHPLPVVAKIYGNIEGLPQDDGYYIVSGMVRAALNASPLKEPCAIYRERIVAPGTGPGDNPERDSEGKITAVRTFVW